MLKIILIIVSIIPLTSWCTDEWKNWVLSEGCSLYKIDGEKIRSYPGYRCLYLDDGRYVSMSDKSLKMYSNKDEVLWEMKGHFHHRIQFSNDMQRILVLSSDYIKDEKLVRYDKLMIVSLDGKVLSEKSFYPVSKSLKLADRMRELADVEKSHHTTKVDYENSHINSFYEIPKNFTKDTPDFLKKSRYVAAGRGDGVFFFSEDLSEVIKYQSYEFSVFNSIHDVQILNDGRMLVFNNRAYAELKGYHENSYSSVEIYNFNTGKLDWMFTAQPKQMFYASMGGGAQVLGDIIVFSDNKRAAYIYSMKKNKLLRAVRGTHFDLDVAHYVQDVKVVNVKKFLENHP